MANSVRITENLFITLKDGVKLSTRLWLPSGAHKSSPVPAIFEFLPYRKRDITTLRDEITYQHFAQNGYAGVRVDMRGCGDSTGLFQDEYVLQEQEDALECIDWISKQEWCTGNVGMMGISWGGFNSLQVAARQPESLKAIIAVSFTDDRYSDDIHFKGGAMLMENVRWAASVEMRASFPPEPVFTSDWLKVWLNRLENLQPICNQWLYHQTRDSYWKHGSVSEDYSKVKAATFLISGYADGYTNTVKRTLDNIECPKRAIIGPWVHLYPHIAVPEPRWGFCSEAVKWWDRWLKNKSVPDPPSLVVYIQQRVPVPFPKKVSGQWVTNPSSDMTTYYLNDGKLGKERGDSVITVHTNETCGYQGGAYFAVDLTTLPAEQSTDDQMSEIFETDKFETAMTFFGRPILKLCVASDKPVANVFLRLCLVDSDGNSRLIGYTACNLNHDETHETITLMKPGEFVEVDVELDIIGETAQPGDSLRLAISSTYFPMFVPNPEPITLSVNLAKCQLDIPVLVDSKPLTETIPTVTDCKPHDTVMRMPASWEYSKNINEDGQLIIHTKESSGKKEFLAHGLVTEWLTDQVETIKQDDPTSAALNINHEINWSRGDDWKVNVCYTMNFTMDKDNFYTDETRVAKHNGETVFSRTYKNSVKRNGV